MKTAATLSLALLLLVPAAPSAWAAPDGAKAAMSSSAQISPVKRTIGARIKAGWRKMGKPGQIATVALTTAAAAFGLHEAGMSPAETATVIGTTMSLGVGTMALIAQKAKRVWSSSLAALKLKKLDDAHQHGSWNEVPGLLHELESASQQNAARAAGSKKDAKQQALEASFLNLGIVRAELALNDAPDGKQRLSGATLPAWKSQLGGMDGEAQAKTTSTSEGKLALALVDLKNEITAENSVYARHQQAIAQFEDHVPAMFGGQMAKEVKRAKQLVTELKDGETTGEAQLHGELTLKMRGRVSDRLSSESAEFKQRRTRHADLKKLRDGVLGEALGAANEADGELSSAISDRQQVTFYEAEAAAHTHDIETYVENNQTKTRHVDNSGMYRMMAASSASSARQHADNASRAISRLSGKLQQLGGDATIKSEQLFTPGHGNLSSAGSGGTGWMSELYMPEMLNMFSNFSASSDLSNARSKVGAKLGALRSLDDEVGRRESGELTWLDKQVDTDLSRQMAAAQ